MTGDNKYFDDAANQILNYTRYLWCPEKGVYYHCYHTDTKIHGVAHWSRANGWVFMATADLLSRMPEIILCAKMSLRTSGCRRMGNPLSGC